MRGTHVPKIGTEILNASPPGRRLTAREEADLAVRIAAGDAAAARALQGQWVRYVVFIARRCLRHRSDPEAFLSAAMLGLGKAARNWDPARSRFSTTLTYYVRRELQIAVRKSGQRGFFRAPPRLPRPMSLDGDFGVDRGDVVEAFEPPDHRERAPEDAAAASADRRRVALALDAVGDRERDVIVRRFFGGEPPVEIARTMGVSHQRVDQLQRRGFEQFTAAWRRLLDGEATDPAAVASRRRRQADDVAREFSRRIVKRFETAEKRRAGRRTRKAAVA